VLKAIHLVYADWCPHCVPTTLGPIQRAAKELEVPCVLYDIDTDDEKKADELVERYGDWSPDYLIPQVFVETDDGKIEHVMTGDPRGLQYTRQALEALLKSKFVKQEVSGNQP
jgi:thiol-disulfide isomerase/thioredoxin